MFAPWRQVVQGCGDEAEKMEDRRVGERRCSLTHIRDAVNRTDKTRIEGRRGSYDFKSESPNE